LTTAEVQDRAAADAKRIINPKAGQNNRGARGAQTGGRPRRFRPSDALIGMDVEVGATG
jgi:hypothetical protein